MPSDVAFLPALLVVAAALGLAIGSFLNVVVYRSPLGLSLSHPGSRCPSCGTPILARHNVPLVGWLVLRGRCHTCRTPISARYPLVEAGTGVAYAVVVVALVDGADQREFAALAPVPAWLWLAASLVAAALIELDGHRVPPRFAALTPAAVAVLLVAADLSAGAGWVLIRAGIGGVAVAAALAVVRAGRAELIGLGAAAGLALGAVSWLALAAGGAGCVVAALAAAALPSRRVPVIALLAVAAALGLAAATAMGY